MSEEEKKAIEYLHDICTKSWIASSLEVEDFESIEIVLNLIEKQAKEIEELKSDNYELNNRINDLLKEE